MKQITVTEHTLSGIKLIKSTEWNGELYQMSRAAFVEHKADSLFGRPGIYVIYSDHFDKQAYGRSIYIGQGDEVRTRLESHTANKKFWNRILFFTAEWMNIAYAFNVENEFISLARLADRYILDNEVGGQTKQLGEEDRDRYEKYIAAAKGVVSLANIDIFTLNEDGIFASAKDFMPKASLRVTDWDLPSVAVTAGSIARLDSSHQDVQPLLAVGKLSYSQHKREYVFNEDTEISVGTNTSIPNILGIHATWFENDRGVNLVDMLKAVRDGRIQRPPR